MNYGINADFWIYDKTDQLRTCVVKDILYGEIEKAAYGLKLLDVDKEIVDLLYGRGIEDRIYKGTPSDRLYRYVEWSESLGSTRKQGIWDGVNSLQQGSI